jgi:WD40 repeat protein
MFSLGNPINKDIEINVLSYFGHKEDIYSTLTSLSKSSLQYLRKRRGDIEKHQRLRHKNERFMVNPVKAIEEHSSGVNQMALYDSKSLITVSDDCTLKVWSTDKMKV